MSDYDPFKDYEPNREIHQRINQINSQIGAPAVLDWTEIDPMAKQMADVAAIKLSELDSNPLAQAVAAEMVQSVLRPPEFADDVRTDTRWCPEYDESYSARTWLRAIVYSVDLDSCRWVPLMRIDQWKRVAEAYLDPELVCQAHNHPDCQYFNDAEPFCDELTAYPVKRGETICIFYACATCRERMKNPDWTADDYVQRGPLPWYDDGPEHDDPWC